ncbi:VanZ family protein [Promicromonospora soli]|uniref:VanZ-like domain-containing protein n=1 Tax=Promicromonospora soli TaxID=2035533 RepID=A0A919G744_9MICO|nr:VanZ family protein [Promicromonospora soli]GHH79268.1 hypothetical protein GCM10017772_44600 [Promicromonospora soli]
MLVSLAVVGVATVAFGPAGTVLRMLSMPIRSWHDLAGTWNGVAIMTVVTLPLAALALWILARRRRAAGMTSAWRMSVAEVGVVYGTVPFVWLTMQPGSGAGTVPGRLSLVPLHDLQETLAEGATGQIAGNLLVFAALGFFAPIRFAPLASVPRVLALAAACSVLIEVAQYVLRLDRVSSVDDVLLNAAGAGLAALASHPWWRSTPRPAGTGPRIARGA